MFGRRFQLCETSDICDCDWFLERSIATFPPLSLSLCEFFSVLWTVRSGFARNCTQTDSTFLSVLHEAKYVQQVRNSQTQGIHRLIIHTHSQTHTKIKTVSTNSERLKRFAISVFGRQNLERLHLHLHSEQPTLQPLRQQTEEIRRMHPMSVYFIRPCPDFRSQYHSQCLRLRTEETAADDI